MMKVEADFKKKKSNGEDTTTSKVKDWVSPYVITKCEDHSKHKNFGGGCSYRGHALQHKKY